MAEEVGFEPTVAIHHNGFRDRPIRPLWHPSVCNSNGESAQTAKKFLQQSGAFLPEDPVLDRRIVVDTRIGHHVVETRCRACFQVGSPVHQSSDAGVHQSTCTHDARLERDNESAVVETPCPENFARIPQRKHLGVCRRVAREFSFVVSTGNDLAVANDHCAHGNIPGDCRRPGLVECHAHRVFVRHRLKPSDDWRKRWDSNPRKLSLHTLSKRADSAALALFHAGVLRFPRVSQAICAVR